MAKQRRFVSKQGHRQPHIFTRRLGTKSTTVKWPIRLFALSLLVPEFLAINSQLS